MRCWYTRWQISNALDRGDLASYMTRGHAAGCASCQAFGSALTSLDAGLARGAPTAPTPARAPRRTRRPWLVAAPLALGAAAAAIALGLDLGGAPTQPVAVEPQPPPVQLAGTMVLVRGVADQFSQALANTPLDTELQALLHDGRRGLDAVLATGGLRRTQ